VDSFSVFPLRRLSWTLCALLAVLGPAHAAHATEPTPLEDNRRITLGYIDIAYELGGVLDPTLQPGGTSDVRPCWFVFAPHASRTGGQGMLTAALARKMIAAARGQPSLSVTQAIARLGVSADVQATLQNLSANLVLQGLPIDGAVSVASLVTSLNSAALADARTASFVTQRLAALYWSAPGTQPLDKAEALPITLERLLHEGNLAIFNDIGGSARLYLDWRQGLTGAVTPERVLSEFSLQDAVAQEASQAYAYGVAHANDVPRPTLINALFPGMHYKSLLVAAFALYEASRQATTPAARDALIAMGTNYVAWREQFDMAQPVFTPAVPSADEVSRSELLRLLTPVLKTDFGTLEWTYADYAYSQGDRDGNPLTSPPTEYNWATFADRWSGILYAFEQAYGDPSALWAMPQPIVDPTSP
jgi:hypothetical protein